MRKTLMNCNTKSYYELSVILFVELGFVVGFVLGLFEVHVLNYYFLTSTIFGHTIHF